MADSKSYAKMIEEARAKAKTNEPKLALGTPPVKKNVEEFVQTRASVEALLQKKNLELQELCAKLDQQKRTADKKLRVTAQVAPAAPARQAAPDQNTQKKYIALLEEEVAKLKTQTLKMQVYRETDASIQSEMEELRRLVGALKEELIEAKAQNISLREKIFHLQKREF